MTKLSLITKAGLEFKRAETKFWDLISQLPHIQQSWALLLLPFVHLIHPRPSGTETLCILLCDAPTPLFTQYKPGPLPNTITYSLSFANPNFLLKQKIPFVCKYLN